MAIAPAPSPLASSEQRTTPEVVERALSDLKELVELEVKLAKHEALAEVRRAKTTAILGVGAIACIQLGLSLLFVALVLQMPNPGAAAAIGGGVLVAAAIACALVAKARFPNALLPSTQKRLLDDARRLKEHAK